MAANEHKNLSDINRHNPLGFEVAINETVLSKGLGTNESGTDGNLLWQKKSLMGVTNYKVQGYANAILTNYVYGEDIDDNRSPFQMDIDYGSAVVASGSIQPRNYFRIGQGFVVNTACNVESISGYLTSNHGYVYTIAICKITPVPASSSNVVPTVIDEIEVTGGASHDKLVRVLDSTITNSSVLEGDIIFPMLKSATSGSNVFINLTIETTTY
tara:strand:- start:1280 stop:1921 length:642 start_codon:yes stop_codon:yes gene_type:complete